MARFWHHVKQVIYEADILIEVLDARHIKETRNPEIEEKVLEAGKKLLYVINKSDLVKTKKFVNLKPSVYVSSTQKLGTTILLKKILELSRGEPVIIGVLGYPNVGKSSLINALAGKAKARTSSESGFTKGLQKVKVNNKITVLDTPGVFPDKEKDNQKFGNTGAVDFGKIKDPEIVALTIIRDNKKIVEKYYTLQGEDEEDILEKIAKKFKKLQRGNMPDLEAAARLFLKDWQTGKIIL
ncbi:GTPase [Candidatus Woesearchaeota archaeon]|jgi:ribosome biogenesis GTPase A|nr:GTPase [Candidatus Woesearchaeota archaeon]